jgi:ferredoxin
MIKQKLLEILGYFFRWVGFPIEPDVVKLGNPDENSPVLLTCNFNLTVKRVIASLKDIDCYLLIAPTNGINVWCAALGDDFTTDSVLSILKTSGIDSLVNTRTLILPQLSAYGIDPVEIKEKTGWTAIFGPVEAKDIGKFLKNEYKKTVAESSVNFPVKRRLEMANIYIIPLVILFTFGFGIYSSIISRFDILLYFNTIFLICGMIYICFLISPYFSRLSGRLLVSLFTLVVIIIVIIINFVILRDNFYLVWNIIATVLVGLMLFEDIRGFSPIYKSEVGQKLWKKGEKRMKFMMASFKLNPYGQISLNRGDCIGCIICVDVCPRNIYNYTKEENKVSIQNSEDCINCNACIVRCPVNCISIV